MIIDPPGKQKIKRLKRNNKNKSEGTENAGTAAPKVAEPTVVQPESSVKSRTARENTNLILQEPDVDKEKVDAIKKAIADGTYKVNAESIAEKLMETELQLSDKGKE